MKKSEVTDETKLKRYFVQFAFVALVPLLSAAFGSYVTADRAISRIDERLTGLKEMFVAKSTEQDNQISRLIRKHSEIDANVSRNTAWLDYLERFCFDGTRTNVRER